MFIKGLGTAVPPHRYTQKECWLALAASPQVGRLTPRSRAILKKVLTGKNGIAARHLALDPLQEAFAVSPDTSQARFGVARRERGVRPRICRRAPRHSASRDSSRGLTPARVDRGGTRGAVLECAPP